MSCNLTLSNSILYVRKYNYKLLLLLLLVIIVALCVLLNN